MGREGCEEGLEFGEGLGRERVVLLRVNWRGRGSRDFGEV
jgi:hypothetical protein